MSEYFKKVLVSERLPEERGNYDTNIGPLEYDGPKIDKWWDENDFADDAPLWWLEICTLPESEEALREAYFTAAKWGMTLTVCATESEIEEAFDQWLTQRKNKK